MRIIDRLSILPDKEFSRIIHASIEQNKFHLLRGKTNPHSKIKLLDLFNISDTKEGAEYWKEIESKYLEEESNITDQEYLIELMSGIHETNEISQYAMRKIISHVAISFKVNTKNRKREKVSLRNAIWAYYRVKFELSLDALGKAVFPEHPFDHTTVLNGIKQHNRMIDIKDPIAIECYERVKRLAEII